MHNKYEIRGDVAIIFMPHKSGRVLEAMIDVSCLPKLLNHDAKWYARLSRKTSSYYATSKIVDQYDKKSRWFELSRLIMDAPAGLIVDHINHNTLDNRKSNLRLVNNSLNMINKKGPQKNNSSGYLGVSWSKKYNKWRARVNFNKKSILDKYFDKPEEAARAAQEIRNKFNTVSLGF